MADNQAAAAPEHEFIERTQRRNFALVVLEQKLWVSREVLAELSPVFDAMFFGDFKEAQEGVEEIPLPDKQVDDVVEFLRVTVSAEMKPITSKHKENMGGDVPNVEWWS